MIMYSSFIELITSCAFNTKSPAENSISGEIISIKWCLIPDCSSSVGFAETISKSL